MILATLFVAEFVRLGPERSSGMQQSLYRYMRIGLQSAMKRHSPQLSRGVIVKQQGTAPAFTNYTPAPYLRPFNLGNPIP